VGLYAEAMIARRFKRRLGLCLIVPLVVIILPVAYAQATSKRSPARRYQIVELPLRPLSISDSAWVAGTTDDQQAATWNSKAGLFRILLPSQFTFSECTGINSRGEAVGTASTVDSTRRVAFVVRQNKAELLSGEQARANGIGEDGTVVGQRLVPGSKSAGPALWKNNSLIDLKICCAGSARSSNAQGMVAGDTYDKEGRYHAFVWDAVHGARLLAVPGEEYSSAIALNGRGDILVKATPGGYFEYSRNKRNPIDLPKGTPHAMNNDGIVVGSFGPNPEAQRAFVWDKGHGMQDLNTLVPANSGWTLEVASSVNDRGEIVGWGDHNGKENAGFLLRPSEDQKQSGHGQQ
jgi:probable HAF family extracellular repeat protein